MAKAVKASAKSKVVHAESAQGTLCGQSFSDDTKDFQEVDAEVTCKRCLKSLAAESTKWGAAEAETEDVTTDALEEGDVVHNHGMVIKLGERKTWDGGNGRTVYGFEGTVTNMEDLGEFASLFRGLLQADGKWTIQGNDLARWTRVKR